MSPWSLRPDRSLRSSRRGACAASLLCTCRRTPSVGRRPDGETRSDTRPRRAHPCRMRPATCPPTSEPTTLEQFWFAPRFEDDVRRGIERSRHDEFAVGLAFHGGAVHGGGTTFFSFGHLPSPLILSARQSCPARRSVRSRVGGAARSRRPLLPARAWQACRF